ncbi:MAG: hypothetical protein VXZ67_06370 [Pseudomonadota bacterium]|nr:hypothetical protein [Pseudomonadota bacterium]
MITLARLGDAEILEIIEPLIDNMLDGSANIDHGRHVRDFTDRLKVIVTEENLARQCADYQAHLGVFARREFVALFRREHSVAATWRLFFTRAEDEFVLEAMFVERDGRLQIEHCMIF